MSTTEKLEAQHELKCKIATMKNLIPAYRQRIGDNNDIILKAANENVNYERQIDDMRKFLEAHGEREHTMAEWSKECGH